MRRFSSENAPPVVRKVTRDTGGRVVIDLCGEIDLSVVDQLRTAFDAALTEPLAGVVVDGTDVEFIDSTAIGALVSARNRCGDLSSGFTVIPSPIIERVLRATGLDDMLSGTEQDGEQRRSRDSV